MEQKTNQRQLLEEYAAANGLGQLQETKENFDAAIRDKEAEINVARESLNEAYRTLKKFEVIRDNRDAREQKERDHIDQTELNDVGLETHWRYNSKQ